jgi:Bifunctional DNA primase/polymerase, N-terminal/Primase C terminal 2 (PriCT-2)
MSSAPTFATPLQGALEWARRGRPVFPADGKVALIKDWYNEATTDPEQIKAWAVQFPGCNFAFPPGRSDEMALDVDEKEAKEGKPAKHGKADLAGLQKEHGFKIAHTLVIRTPSGGAHIYLKGVVPSSNGRIAPALDIKSNGGYVLCPGSQIDGNPYTISRDIPLVECPTALLKLIEAAKDKPEIKPQSDQAGDPFTPDQLTQMLACCDPDCPRDDWRNIAAALHAAPCTDPAFDKRDLFVRWSRGEVRK